MTQFIIKLCDLPRKLRDRDASKFHIQLCLALLCMLLVFVTGIDRTDVFGGCVAVSALIHYFTLAAVMWMGAEAVLMYQKLVIIFIQITTGHIIVTSMICWCEYITVLHMCTYYSNSISFSVVPVIPIIFPLSIDREFMVTYKDVQSATNSTRQEEINL